MRASALILAGAVFLSGCSTLRPVYEDVADAMPWQKDDVAVETPTSDYIADDLVGHLDGRIEPMSDVTIVTAESNHWGSLEQRLRKEGYAVHIEKRLRHAKKQPIIYRLDEVLGGARLQGVLDVIGKVSLSRLYYSDDEVLVETSPVTVLEKDTEDDE